MAQPSKAGAVFLFVFGLPFLGFGLFAAWAFLTSSHVVHGNNNPIAGALFALVFALIGAGLMFGAVAGYQKQKQQAAIQEANPNSPWLWQPDWATGRALSRNRGSIVGWWIGTVLASMLVLPIVATALPPLLRSSDPKAFILVGLCLLPLILLIGAVRATIRRKRYGTTYFEFDSQPFSPGKQVSGRIHLQLDTSVSHGIDLKLSCIRRIVVGSGKEQSTNEAVLWQNQKNVPQGELEVGPLGTEIPVNFGIPQDAYETNHDNPRDQMLWILHAKADVPGIDYSDKFEIPVFRTGSGAQNSPVSNADFSSNFGSSFGAAAAATAPAFESDASEVTAPSNPKVVVSATADGSTEFYFPAFRNRSQTLVLVLITTFWSGIVLFLANSRAPWFLAPIFGVFDLLLIYGCFQSMFGSTRILAGNGKLVISRKLLGTGTRREIPFSEIQSITAGMGIQNSSSKNGSFRIQLQIKTGQSVRLVENIADRQEARWVVYQIEKLAGLKIDTHVALQDSLGRAYAAPARIYTGGIRSSPRPIPRANKISAVIGVAMFSVWTGFIVYQFAGFHHKGVQHRAVTISQTGAHNTTGRAAYSPLTDEDVQRIQQLPVQQQAEELLERTIQHDPRALQLFEQNIDSAEWLGQIKLTDRMKDLERRSEYSNDLRVRYANADLNLSMDGWSKNDETADLLIERARTDPHYRTAAVYFMGMLAGRGIAYSRIYPVLLDYAKHDPDETVRVWAIEGMRYLGTDEALDELFNSFVSDPSDRVRDRAGCNVSDCGNFKRTQRMQMVPKFLALAADPSTTAQMRNWSFLALHEITDESLPNDATVWQNWYDHHGAEKLARFKGMDWWQVRGDE
ncbi:MAG TPA: HEAT repeat domain-containing protein [Terriglobales bacterium]|jgi:hypothetical protein